MILCDAQHTQQTRQIGFDLKLKAPGAALLLLSLAVTSNRFAQRRLGRRWQTLHRLVYVAAIGGVIHFWWQVKADITLPRRWAVAVAILLGFRVWWAWRRKALVARPPSAKTP